MTVEDLSSLIRNIPDFPKPGILFKDVTPLLSNGPAFAQIIDMLAERYADQKIDKVAGVESRGFIFSAPLAYRLGAGLVPIRKAGKLPSATYQVKYDLEYGSSVLELHRDAIENGSRVLLVDDLLATGGTVAAAAHLIEEAGGIITEAAFIIELAFLNGRDRLQKYPIYSLIQY